MKVMIVVTHLLGTGHLARALTLARAFVAAGDRVTVVSGGTAVDHFDASGVRLEQLTPLRSDGTDFTTLLRSDGTVADERLLTERQNRLLGILAEVRPDILITELFPFGRRILRTEFKALLEAARVMTPRPVILSSIRDILAPPSKPGKVDYADETIGAFYDGVLVHADPEVVTLQQSWPVSDALNARLHYTGFVAPKPASGGADQSQQVLVSAGGGNVGDAVFRAAFEAAPHLPELQWLLLVGGSDERRAALADLAPSNVSIEAPTPAFRQMLMSAAASVSMAGYNTALDVLQSGVPAVLVPFDDGGEVEQGLRADALAALPAVQVVLQKDLTAAALADRVKAVMAAGRRPLRTQGMDGAALSVEIAHGLRENAP
ncbi:glycosyltransferase family protein [Tateyamaria pelophila]|uniref:glycosyltransferase family protein n=1 Tax=Tateyamaria pelophila TaxID=328415 RepID=UPI001CBEEE13|nr:glycosyltransferase [Tateyamaria pelophila]